MIIPEEIKEIKKVVEEFFQKMTFPVEIDIKTPLKNIVFHKEEENFDTVLINLKSDEPQILIGEKGQTLIEIQNLLGRILNKELPKNVYIDLDINEYKKKKTEYLKSLAKDLADEVALTKKEKALYPMPAYERRIIHMELSTRPDVTTESQGEEPERGVVIKPR